MWTNRYFINFFTTNTIIFFKSLLYIKTYLQTIFNIYQQLIYKYNIVKDNKNDQYICCHKLRTWNISLTTYSITHSFIKNNQPYLLSPITYSKHIRYIYISLYIYYIKWGLRTFSTHFMRTICDHLGRETFISRNVRIPILFTISWLMKHPTRCLTI